MKKLLEANQELIEAIDQQAPAERVIRALSGALEADTIARDGSRCADHRTRVAAATALIQYRIGRPDVKPNVDPTGSAGDEGETLQERMARSPALREMVRDMLNEAERMNQK